MEKGNFENAFLAKCAITIEFLPPENNTTDSGIAKISRKTI
jgi:hypothetical protein